MATTNAYMVLSVNVVNIYFQDEILQWHKNILFFLCHDFKVAQLAKSMI